MMIYVLGCVASPGSGAARPRGSSGDATPRPPGLAAARAVAREHRAHRGYADPSCRACWWSNRVTWRWYGQLVTVRIVDLVMTHDRLMCR